MFINLKWSTKTLHHLSDEMAKSSDPRFPCPPKITQELHVLVLPYWDFQHQEHWGQLVVHREIAKEVQEIFERLFDGHFPIASMVPVAAFHWKDDLSMRANNTIGFCYRPKTGKPHELSQHAFGRAIDINPIQNPYQKNGVVLPQGARYVPNRRGTCGPNSLPVTLFREKGFDCGRDWKSLKDYMHFEKPGET